MKNVWILLALIILLLSGFYFFQANKKSELIPTSTTPIPTAQEELTEDQIIRALSEKNNWDTSRVDVNINTVKGNYAKGDVKFKDEMGGGLWFAAKVNNTWKIVYDGNGIITCDQLTDFQDFPKDLIPSCYDTSTDTLITR